MNVLIEAPGRRANAPRHDTRRSELPMLNQSILERVCFVTNCERLIGRSGARGMCSKHYCAWRLTQTPICSMEGCEFRGESNGLCPRHRRRLNLYGDPHVISDRAKQQVGLAARFYAKVSTKGPVPVSRPELGPCHLWTGATNNRGYGLIRENVRNGNKLLLAHRVGYELENGPIGEGLELDHLCFTTLCVRQSHLEAVTPAVNKQRQRSHGRQKIAA